MKESFYISKDKTKIVFHTFGAVGMEDDVYSFSSSYGYRRNGFPESEPEPSLLDKPDRIWDLLIESDLSS